MCRKTADPYFGSVLVTWGEAFHRWERFDLGVRKDQRAVRLLFSNMLSVFRAPLVHSVNNWDVVADGSRRQGGSRCRLKLFGMSEDLTVIRHSFSCDGRVNKRTSLLGGLLGTLLSPSVFFPPFRSRVSFP